MNHWIVKLGGSLEGGPELSRWLDLIASSGGGRVVVVPGGGRFADRVRAAQRTWAFPDPTAHRMALLAMEQFGDVLAARAPGLVPAVSVAAMRALLSRGRVPLWMPYPMAAFHDAVPATWECTSDSLALWLAQQLGARIVVLVKSVTPPDPACPAQELARLGMVDAAFPAAAQDYAGEIVCLGPREQERLRAAMVRGAWTGARRLERREPA